MRLHKSELHAVLKEHQGKNNGIHITGLVKKFARLGTPCTPRAIRHAVKDLRMDSVPVCATPKDGYYLATTPKELEETLMFLHDRSMSSLAQEAALRKISLKRLYGQKALATTEKENRL